MKQQKVTATATPNHKSDERFLSIFTLVFYGENYCFFRMNAHKRKRWTNILGDESEQERNTLTVDQENVWRTIQCYQQPVLFVAELSIAFIFSTQDGVCVAAFFSLKFIWFQRILLLKNNTFFVFDAFFVTLWME